MDCPHPLFDQTAALGDRRYCPFCLRAENERLRQECQRLRAALERYGTHETWAPTHGRCSKYAYAPTEDDGFLVDESLPCSCGLDAALKEPT